MHLFDIDIPGKITFKESEVLSPGNLFTTFETRELSVKADVKVFHDLFWL